MDTNKEIDYWILEYLLQRPMEEQTLTLLVRDLPIPNDNGYLKKLFCLRKLECKISRQSIIAADDLRVLEDLAKVGFAQGAETVSDTMRRRAYCAVAVECTVKLLENGIGGRYEFNEAVMSLWREMDVRVENLGLGSDELWEWKENIETAVWDDCVCERVRKNGEGIDARIAVDAYIRIERQKMGPTFLQLLQSKLAALRGNSAQEEAGEKVRNADQIYIPETAENDLAAQCDMGTGNDNSGNVDHVARKDVNYVGIGSVQRKKLVDQIVEQVERKERNSDHPEGEVTKSVDQGAELELDGIGHITGEEVKNADQVYTPEPAEHDMAPQCDMGTGNNNNCRNVDHVAREHVDYVDIGSVQRKGFIDQIVEEVEGRERNTDHPEGEVTKSVDQVADLELNNIDHIAREELVRSNSETEIESESINRRAGDDGCNDDKVGRPEMECVDQAARGDVRDINQTMETGVFQVAEEAAQSHKDESHKGRIRSRDKLVGVRHPQVLGRQRGAKIVNSDEMEGGGSPRKDNLPRSTEVKMVREAGKLNRLELQAEVEDPLPEALQYAEAVRRHEVAKNKCQELAKENLVGAVVFLCDANGVIRAPDCGVSNVFRPSLMERNATAHTFAWDDSIDGSDENPSMHHLPSPRVITVPPLNIYQAKKRRRVPRKWSVLEEDTLRAGVEKYGKGNWKAILHAYRDEFEDRTEVDLKDKWRNLTRG